MSSPADKRIRFACGQCDQLLSIGGDKVGRQIRCPKCQHANTVPNPEAAALQIADRKAAEAARQQESSDALEQFEVFDQEDTEFIIEGDNNEAGYYYGSGKFDPSKVAVSRSILYAQGALLSAVALAAFVFGCLVGFSVAPRGDTTAEDNTPRVVRGRLSFQDAANRQQPDAGSVVIVVPQDAVPGPDEKIDAIGLRPDDPPPEADHAGLQQLSVMGGAYARTDVDGTFRLQVPKRGKYFLLIISGNAKRASSEELNKEHLAQMGRYFVPAIDLLGQNRFRWTEERIGADIRADYTFGES